MTFKKRETWTQMERWKHYQLEEFVDFVNFLLSFEGFHSQKTLHFFPLFFFFSFSCGYLHAPHHLNENINA